MDVDNRQDELMDLLCEFLTSRRTVSYVEKSNEQPRLSLFGLV